MLMRDHEGYLTNRDDWSPAVARALAAEEGIELTADHWEVLTLVQEFYAEFELSPAMRPLVKRARERLGADRGTSRYLLSLFPGSPARLAAKIAGLPRPANCL